MLVTYESKIGKEQKERELLLDALNQLYPENMIFRKIGNVFQCDMEMEFLPFAVVDNINRVLKTQDREYIGNVYLPGVQRVVIRISQIARHQKS